MGCNRGQLSPRRLRSAKNRADSESRQALFVEAENHSQLRFAPDLYSKKIAFNEGTIRRNPSHIFFRSAAGPETLSVAGPETLSAANPETRSAAGPETLARLVRNAERG